MKTLFMSLAIFFFCAESFAEDEILKIQDIQCRGNETTTCTFIEGHLFIQKGDNLNEDEIQNAKLRLSSLSNFKNVDIHLEKGIEKNQVILVIDVVETDPLLKEINLGVSKTDHSAFDTISARLSHQNIFGTGKILDLELANNNSNLKNQTANEFYSRLQYVDPLFLNQKKYFMIAGMTFENKKFSGSNLKIYSDDPTATADYNSKLNQLGVDLNFGMRFGNFSYLTAGFELFPYSHSEFKENIYENRAYKSIDNTYSTKYAYQISYGFNSEDDPYFPTKGSRFSTHLRWDSYNNTNDTYFSLLNLGYRTNWQTSGASVWTLKLGSNPSTEFTSSLDKSIGVVSLAYAHPYEFSSNLKTFFGGIEKARWYVEPGLLNYSSLSGAEAGVKIGTRLQTKDYGNIDLFLFYSAVIGQR